MDRREILQEAERIVCGDRQDEYGSASASFERIAEMWRAYLGVDIEAMDVANMYILTKVSRSITSPDKLDTWLDICGYAALAGEILTDGSE